MDLMEYRARELFAYFGIPVKPGYVSESAEMRGMPPLQFPLVVKAQVLTGGRGKAGGIKFAQTPAELKNHIASILGMDIKGHRVEKVYIVEKAEVEHEYYLSIMLDRAHKCPMIIFSTHGGMDIEETAKSNPDAIIKIPVDPFVGVRDFTAGYLFDKAGVSRGASLPAFKSLLENLYRMFNESRCLLTEINPLGVDAQGNLIALDGKVSIDDSAVKAYADLQRLKEPSRNPLIRDAEKYGFLYIPCDENGTIGVMSNGSGLIMSTIDMLSKGGMRVGAAMDLGGGATADRIKEAYRIMTAEERIRAVFINIFGGITRCDEVALGTKLAVESCSERKAVVIRFEGTNKEKGLSILNEIGDCVLYAESLADGARILGKRLSA